jgi:hypothetical protein
MNIIETLLESLSRNHSQMSGVQKSRFLEMFKVNSGGILTSRNKNKEKLAKDIELFEAVTLSSEMAGLVIQEDKHYDEIELTRKCIELRNMLENGKLDGTEKNDALNKLKETYTQLLNVRDKYDEAVEHSGSVNEKARMILKRIKTPFYSQSTSKRDFNHIDESVEGVEDSFYDAFRELYGEKGLEGYREENLEMFKKISEDDVKLASKHYMKVETPLFKHRNLFAIPMTIASFILYPQTAPFIGPITHGLGAYILSVCLTTIGMNSREKHNKDIFEARLRIAKDLGILDKEFKGWSPDDTYRFDYSFNNYPYKKEKEDEK